MDFAIHSADISQKARPFEIDRQWVYLLFDEFFEQGDMEKQQGLPISMLCDRDTTKVAGSQPSFVDFVVMPLFQTLTHLVPELQSEGDCLDNIKANKKRWSEIEETESEKEIYKINATKNPIMVQVHGVYKHDVQVYWGVKVSSTS